MTNSPVLLVHIAAGSVGFLSGMLALTFRKGYDNHRNAGNVFFVSMLIMSTTAVYMAAMTANAINILVGALTFYLVLTSWLTAARARPQVRLVADTGAFMLALIVAGGGAIYGLEATKVGLGVKDGNTPGVYFFFGGVALFAAVMDIVMMARGGVFGAHRIARHLWRMCFAMLIAAVSSIPRIQRMLPKPFQDSMVFSIPIFLIIALMLFWLARVLCTNTYRESARNIP